MQKAEGRVIRGVRRLESILHSAFCFFLPPAMHIGVDFDNTIACYDGAFHAIALSEGLIPQTLPRDKTSVRDHLRATGREDRWTAFQGLIYGERMGDAAPFPGVLEFFRACAADGLKCSIISHRTRQPIVGPPRDLHAAARSWLTSTGIAEIVPADRIFFEETRREKVARVSAQGCTHFIDDLPEFLSEPDLPAQLVRIHFAPAGVAEPDARFRTVSAWPEIRALFAS
jgi:hypothetical protein